MTRWSELSPTTRRILLAAGAVDGVGRLLALTDLARRPREQIRGNKTAWAISLAVVSSAGVLPAVYFLRGRRR